jgi:hypothetical protein
MIRMLSLATLSVLLFITPRIDFPDTASLAGRVTGQNSVGIAGASVSARNKFSGQVYETATGADGAYKLTGLRPGRYSALAAAQGRGCVWVHNVFLFSGEHTRLDFVLSGSETRARDRGCDDDDARGAK